MSLDLTETKTLKEFGLKIRAERKSRKWTQQQLSEASGVNKTTVSYLENGHLGSLAVSRLRSLADCLGLKIIVDAKKVK